MTRTGLRLVAVVACVAVLAGSRRAHAQQRIEEARAAYLQGKTAYEEKRFPEALEAFERSYALSGQPALLYNVASTLQHLNRPGDAAKMLRDFLHERPTDGDRAEVEERIVSLERAQAFLDREAQRQRAKEAEERRRAEAGDHVGWLQEVDVERRMSLVKAHERHRRTRLAIGLGVGFGVLAIGGITVGIVCGLGRCSLGSTKDYDLDRFTVTP